MAVVFIQIWTKKIKNKKMRKLIMKVIHNFLILEEKLLDIIRLMIILIWTYNW